MSTNRHRRIAYIVVGVLAVAAAGTYALTAESRYPKRFAAVVDGRLYRSGLVTPNQLRHLRDDFGVRRVISLLAAEAPETQAERAAAEELGVEWRNVPMRGDGSSTPEARAAVLELLAVPNAPPTLVHCAAGTNRTGLAVGLYRICFENWTYEQVLEEMRRFDFEDLPKHENLRQALREAAATSTSQPAANP